MKINKITYKGGMINKLSEIDALEKIELEGKYIPDNILKVIEENKIY